MDRVERRFAAAWAALVALTLLSWLWPRHAALPAGAVLILLALLKVCIVIREFMAIRHAPLPLRTVLDLWLVLVAAALLSVIPLLAGRSANPALTQSSLTSPMRPPAPP